MSNTIIISTKTPKKRITEMTFLNYSSPALDV